MVQTGVTGKAKQRSRAAVRRIQAAVGVVPRPAACDREECSETRHLPPDHVPAAPALVQLLRTWKETSIFPLPLCT